MTKPTRIRRALIAVLVGLAQVTLIMAGSAVAFDSDMALGVRVMGTTACVMGMTWIRGEAETQGRREGFTQGWNLRGLSADVLGFRHMTRGISPVNRNERKPQ